MAVIECASRNELLVAFASRNELLVASDVLWIGKHDSPINQMRPRRPNPIRLFW